MTSRLRDVLALSLGTYLSLLGVLFFLDSAGVWPLGVAGLVEGSIGIALIILGVLAMLASLRVRRFARRMSRTFGHVHSAEEWRVDDAVVRTVIGDILLDLRQATLPDGETELTLLCWLGTIQVRAPRDVGLDVTAQTVVGTVDVLGTREEGVIRDIAVQTDGYEQAPRRLKLRLSTFVGELLVVRSER
ncbi:MAG: cell wall-active antibiotics response protein LiaF [Chloroflexota bacterium]